MRANGMAYYFKILDPSRHNLCIAESMSVRTMSITTPRALSRSPTPPIPTSSPDTSYFQSNMGKASVSGTPRQGRQSAGGKNKQFHPHHLFLHPFFSSHRQGTPTQHHPLRLVDSNGFFGRAHENPVGVFESQRFLNLEARTLAHPDADSMLACMRSLLSESSADLLVQCAETLEYVDGWLKYVPTGHVVEFITAGEKQSRTHAEALARNDIALGKLQTALDEYRSTKR